MSSYVDSCNLKTTSPNTMFSFDLSGRASSRYEGVNVNGIFTTSVQREEMKTSLRGSTDPPLLPSSGPQITMVSSSSTVDANGLNYCGGALLLGREREPEQRSAKSGCSNNNKSQEVERNAENTQTTAKRHSNVSQRQDSEQQQQQRPQIYPWMTKLHMSHGKVLPCFSL